MEKKKKPIQVLCDICETTDRCVNVARRLWDDDCTSGCAVGDFVAVASPQDASDIFPTKIVIAYQANAKTRTDSIENDYP